MNDFLKLFQSNAVEEVGPDVIQLHSSEESWLGEMAMRISIVNTMFSWQLCKAGYNSEDKYLNHSPSKWTAWSCDISTDPHNKSSERTAQFTPLSRCTLTEIKSNIRDFVFWAYNVFCIDCVCFTIYISELLKFYWFKCSCAQYWVDIYPFSY